MSIIITGMEMPKNCVECSHMDLQETLNCQLIFSGCANCGRHPNCPLKSVDGLMENIKTTDRDYRYNGHNLSIDGVINIIKEYCEVEE